MDKSLGVYKVNPVIRLPEKIDLPTCMYAMRNVINSLARNATQNNRNELLDTITDKEPLPELSSLERRVDSVIEQLSELVEQVNALKSQLSSRSTSTVAHYALDKTELNNLKVFEGCVINANPSNPPYSLFLINHLSRGSITFSTHVHSSVDSSPKELKYYESNDKQDSLKITLIWKKVVGSSDSELVLNPVKELPTRGEVNILRHMARSGLKLLKYPNGDAVETVHMDSVLDLCHRLVHSQAAKERTSLLRNLNAKLEKNAFYGGDSYNICDISAWSAIKQISADPGRDLTPNMAKWYSRMDELTAF